MQQKISKNIEHKKSITHVNQKIATSFCRQPYQQCLAYHLAFNFQQKYQLFKKAKSPLDKQIKLGLKIQRTKTKQLTQFDLWLMDYFLRFFELRLLRNYKKMKREQRKKDLQLFLTCKQSDEYRFLLRSVTEESRRDLNVEMCFCSSGGCTSLPRIIDYGDNWNVGQLFFELSSNAEVSPIFKINLSRSEVFEPAQGQNKDGVFPGLCKVCVEKYDDYKEHIQMETHRQKIANNKSNQWIIETCRAFQSFEEGPKRKKDKYANRNGKTRKLKYDSRNTKTGKFEKKCKE